MNRPPGAWRRRSNSLIRAPSRNRRYAGEHGSRRSSLSRHDHIVFERY
jgi:hypothetical protein